MRSIKCTIILCCLGFISCEYNIPEVKIEVIPSGGVRASIPDHPEIKLFSFHGFTKSTYRPNAEGDIHGEAYAPSSGRWIVEDTSETLKLGESLAYYVVVQANNKILTKEGQFLYTEQQQTTKAPANQNSGDSCEESVTVVKGAKACKGRVIFEDNFDTLSSDWQKEKKLGRSQADFPFTSYQPDAVQKSDGKLQITASIEDYTDDTVTTGSLNLAEGCTEPENSDCSMQAQGSNILPPTKSGKVNTKRTFSFKYGVVQVRAKLPGGDWLYPEILLEPKDRKYGTGYSSGTVVIGQAANSFNQKQNVFGRLLVDKVDCYDKLTRRLDTSDGIFQEFHVYEIRWEPDFVSFTFDGEEYGRISNIKNSLKNCKNLNETFIRWSTGTKLAPFDEEFYLSLGVGVGGVLLFPDDVAYKTMKSWKNKSVKAVLNFWNSRNTWKDSWQGDNNQLLIDSVKVYAL